MAGNFVKKNSAALAYRMAACRARALTLPKPVSRLLEESAATYVNIELLIQDKCAARPLRIYRMP